MVDVSNHSTYRISGKRGDSILLGHKPAPQRDNGGVMVTPSKPQGDAPQEEAAPKAKEIKNK